MVPAAVAVIMLVGYNLPRALSTILLIFLSLLIRFIHQYRKARAQFPGPPVKSFWVGNLDQTMTDDVHEKVPPPPYKLSRIVL
ncbi:uncharacterized protein N7483_009147 [Penicillium malachiteum]|uniref:uncharacterized protein n=1 Tax=Penicillium malachiteum TaxID=1324776 RepID=UPI0025492089|nr:uncharacterized protein N7483_009147 [Penicillium malachiteum]KAJ5721213.1 hypothetical protein N7483_009147 [Penicillium malachiteum]